MLPDTGSWRQSLRKHKAPVHIVHEQPGVQKAHTEKFPLLQLLWLQKVLLLFPYVSCFMEMRKLLSAKTTDATCPLSKLGSDVFLNMQGRLSNASLLQKMQRSA